MNSSKDPKGMADGKGGRSPSPRWVLASLALSMLMPSLDTSIANVGLPTLARAFSATFQQAQWIVLAYLLALTTLIVSAGRLGDLFGRRRLLQAGILVFTGASLLCGAAAGFRLLLAARALQGLGAAMMIASTLALVGAAVPKDRTGRAMGLLGTMSAIGTLLGPSLGGALITGFGWRSIFLVNVPLGVLNLVLVRRHLPADRSSSAQDRGFDGPGTLLLVLTLAAYALAMTLGHGHSVLLRTVLVALAVLGGALFVRQEARTASPLIPVARFRDPALNTGLPMNLLVSSVMMATLVVGPFYLALALGLPPARVGLVMAVGPLLSTLGGLLAGRAVDRFGGSPMALAGLGLMAAGATALAALPTRFGVPGYLAAILVLTPGYQLFQAANNATTMLGAHPDQRGVISGLLSLSRNLGLITGAAFLGAVFAFASGAADPASARPAAVAAGFRITFGVAAFLVLLAGALALAGRRVCAGDRMDGCLGGSRRHSHGNNRDQGLPDRPAPEGGALRLGGGQLR